MKITIPPKKSYRHYRAAIHALGGIPSERTVPILRPFLNSVDSGSLAAEALRRNGMLELISQTPEEKLEVWISTDDESNIQANWSWIKPMLLKTFLEKEGDDRHRAFRVLIGSRDLEFVPTVTAWLDQNDLGKRDRFGFRAGQHEIPGVAQQAKNSGIEVLQMAADRWAERNGYVFQ